MKSDIILVYPRTSQDLGGSISPPFSILTIVAPLREEGYNIKIIDQRTDSDWKKILEKQLKLNPICIGVSSMTGFQIHYALQVMNHVKNLSPETKIVFGGIHPTIMPEQSLMNPSVDYVVRNEGEVTFQELVHAIEGNQDISNILGLSYKINERIINNPPQPFIDLNRSLPTPWDLIDVKKYIHRVVLMGGSARELDIGETSRGCPFDCKFCYNVLHHRRCWRSMSTEKTVEKIIMDVKKFNLDAIWLRDDNFFVDFKRVEGVANALIKEKLDILWYTSGIRIDLFNRMEDNLLKLIKKSGCDSFRFGVESGSQRILDLIGKRILVSDVFLANKKCRKYDLTPHYSFMCGFPSETVQDIMKTVDVAIKLKKENPKSKMHPINVYAPYPGTELFESCVKEGFNPPETLEEWSYIDWMSKDSRFLSYLPEKVFNKANSISNLSYFVSDAVRMVMPEYLKILVYPILLWSDFRWNKRFYKYDFDMKIFRHVVDKLLGK